MNEKLKKMLETKIDARAKLIEEMAATDDKELRASQLEMMNNLDAEINELSEIVNAEPQADPDLQARAKGVPDGGFSPLTQSKAKDDTKDTEELEKRGADLRAGKPVIMPKIEARAAVQSTSGLVIEKKYSRELSPKFNEVSSLIDRVNSVPLPGGESYTRGFEIAGGEGDYTAEGAAATAIEPTYGTVEIAKSKITAYAEITEEVKKLPNIDYVTYISGEVRKALRKKITKQIIAGAGTTNTLTGIYNAPAKVIPTAYDMEMTTIDEDTLNEIVFAYGGDEDVEDDAVLVLSKADLRAFSNVKNSEKKRIYKITKHGNTGTIEYADGGVAVDYIINSACKSLSAERESTAVYTMVYGRLSAYEMPVFSDIEIMESTDYKFKEGMIAFKGSVFTGGNVAAYKSWLRVKKPAKVTNPAG